MKNICLSPVDDFTLSVPLYRGVSRGDETDDQQQAGMPGEGRCRVSSVCL